MIDKNVANKNVADTLSNFYGYKLQKDDSRTSRLYLNTSLGNNKEGTILIARGYSNPSSISISHSYNGEVGTPNDPAHHIYEATKGVVGYIQKQYAKIQNIISQASAIKTLLIPDNTLASDIIEKGVNVSKSLQEKLEPYISIFESRSASYDEARGYTGTNFLLQTNITIVLYPKLIDEEDLSYLYYSKSLSNDKLNELKGHMISPASQLKTLLRFLTGRTEYQSLDINTTKEKITNENVASTKGVSTYVPNPLTLGKTGYGITTDADLVNKTESDSNFIRYRRILPPNGYKPKSDGFAYGIEGTFRLISGGTSDKIDKSNDNITNVNDIYGSNTRSSTGSNFYDNLLITDINISNSDTVMKMKTFDFDANRYLDEVTPEYITVTLGFGHAYTQYDFNEVYWALGLSSLSDMTSNSYDYSVPDDITPEKKLEKLKKIGEDENNLTKKAASDSNTETNSIE